jgi:hypothetical protein
VSYDVDLVIDTGGEGPAHVMEIGNYTYNCGEMFALALGHRLGELHGRLAGESIPNLRRAVLRFEHEFAQYQALNPPNGWGDAKGALNFLRDILAGCELHPKTTIRVS